ncbi:hypothetical protein TPA0910_02550 [Streptomyces hygroscopicus subsp. sporocinereus]|uniref:CdaR GGDEF-like domain-containing protein n=1 Tax=Streptomyces hygroscopicus TaxID=1912 RepID=A0ABQ3TR53_STRHY|nr:hypothetical protein TPA0910_02550 [Streptomyces hygroscopicus]
MPRSAWTADGPPAERPTGPATLLDAPDRAPRLLRERAARLRADLDAPHVVLAAGMDAPGTGTPVTGPGGTPGGGPGASATGPGSRTGSGSGSGPGGGPCSSGTGHVSGSGGGPGAPAEDAAGRRRLWSAASHLAAARHGLAAARDGGTVLLLPLDEGDTADALARRTARQLGTAVHAPVTVGASAPVAAPAARPGEVAAGY